MAIDIAGLKAAAAGSEEDKINWYVSQLKAGYTDAEITAAVDKALGSSYATAKAGTKEGDEWNYLQDKAAEKIIKNVSTGSAKEKATAYNQLYQGAGLTNDEIQQNILDIAGKQDPEQMRALLGMAGAQRASKLATGGEKAEYVKQMIGYGYTPEEIVSYINTAVGPQTSGDMSELFRLAGVQLPGSNQQQPGTDYQGTVTGGSGVDFKGSTGLREAYGPYALDYLSRASALLGLRDAENYQPIKFGTAEKGGTYGADTAKTLASLQTQRENMMGMGTGANATPAYQPYKYSFAPKPAKSGGIMSLVEGYDAGGNVSSGSNTGMQGTEVVSSAFDKPTGFTASTYSSGYSQPTDIYKGPGETAFNTNLDTSNIYKGPGETAFNTNLDTSNIYKGPGDSGITTGSFDSNAISRFTNPFTTAVTDPQVREAKRQAELARQSQAAKFSQAGAFGGSRSILAENELGRNLATQIGDIYGKGQKEAYDAALRAFEAEAGRKLTAGIETERARQEAGRQGLTGAEAAARLGLEAQKASEQAKQVAGQQALTGAETAARLGLEAQKASEQAKQVAGQQALTGAETAARYGLEANRLGEQSSQFAANLGLQTAQSEAQYQQLARDLQQRAEEAAARGDQFAANLALQQLAEANRAAEATRQFEYTQARDTYLDPFRELGYASQLLQGLPISAAATGVSPITESLISALGLGNILGVGNTTKTSDRRLKTDIQTIGVLGDGLRVYSYRYKSGGPVHIGVMADEVAVLRPQAYIKGGAGDGFDAVDYSKL